MAATGEGRGPNHGLRSHTDPGYASFDEPINNGAGRRARRALAQMPSSRRRAARLLSEADQYMARNAYAEAISTYQRFLELKPHDLHALTNLGAAYWKLGQYPEAEEHVRHAIRVKPQAPDPHSNLGVLLRNRGEVSAAEGSFRRALKLEPRHLEARSALGWTLIDSARLLEAKKHFDKALRLSPHHAGALLGLVKIAKSEGRFADAETLIQRVLATNPQQPSAWAALTELRKMTVADHAWLERAEAIATGVITPLQEIDLRFAMGKYHDDVGEFARAFENYRRANELKK